MAPVTPAFLPVLPRTTPALPRRLFACPHTGFTGGRAAASVALPPAPDTRKQADYEHGKVWAIVLNAPRNTTQSARELRA